MVKNKEIFDAYVYVCSECECLYGCNVPTKDAGRVRKDCRKCDEKYGCVHRLVYKLGRDDENIKPEWSGQNQEGIIIKSDGLCSEECAILRNSEAYSDAEIRDLLGKNDCPKEDIEEIIILLGALKRFSMKTYIKNETQKYLIAIFRKILKVEERIKEDREVV